MAASEQIKSLITSYAEEDDHRFFATAMQIAASEARQGHTNVAQELKLLIERARKDKSISHLRSSKEVSIFSAKRELKELVDVFKPRITFKDMVLAPEVEDALTKLIHEQSNWELLKKHNLSPRRKLLLTGLPGTGKTMTAQAIAGELGLLVYIVRLDGLMSKYLGESIAKLRMLFDAMEEHRAVYLFDEFDSIGSQRDNGQDIGEIKRVLNSFLINIEKDDSNSIIIAATNLPNQLDKALFRRFDDVVNYPLPNVNQITDTIKKATKEFNFIKRTNLKKIAESAIGLNYSEITKACEDAIKKMILAGGLKLDASEIQKALSKKNH